MNVETHLKAGPEDIPCPSCPLIPDPDQDDGGG